MCHHGFDALAALTDEELAAPSADLAAEDRTAAPVPDDTITVEELGTGEVIELGAANDDVLPDEMPATAAEQASSTEADEARGIEVTDSLVTGVEAITLSSGDEATWLGSESPAAASTGDFPEPVPGSESFEPIQATEPADLVAGTEPAAAATILTMPEPFLPAAPPESAAAAGVGGTAAAVEEKPAADPAWAGTPALSAQPVVVTEAVSPEQAATGSEPVEPPPEALEFTGSEDDLERVFVTAHQPPLPARGWTTPAERSTDLTGGSDILREASTPAATVAAADSADAEDAAGAPAPDATHITTDVRSDAAWPETPEAGTAPGSAPPATAPTGAARYSDAQRPVEDALCPDATAPTGAARYSDLDATDEFPVLVLDETDTPDAATARRFGLETEGSDAGAGPGALAAPGADAGTLPAVDDVPLPLIPIPEGLRRTMQARAAQEDEFGSPAFTLDEPRWWERSRVWVAASVLALLTLLAQAVHYNRDTLARHPIAGPWLLRTYGLLGLEVPTPSDLAAIELRQWGASSDPRRPGRLHLRASLLNTAPFAQPYPVLRVTLHDRFGNALGSRDVGARDYLPGGAPERRLLLAGQRLDAEIVLVDPGSDAVGYEIELCREDRDGVRCRGTAAPTT